MKISTLVPLLSLLGVFTVSAQDSSTTSTTTTTDTPAATTTSATGQIDPAKEAEIRKLLELSGTIKLTNEALGQMISSFKQQNSGVPDEFWDRFQKEMDAQGLVEKIIPLYDKYYSLEDLKALNAFYESPAGKRMLAATPQIMRDSMQIGREWGQEVGEKISKELQEEKAKAAAGATSGSTGSAPPSSAPAQSGSTP